MLTEHWSPRVIAELDDCFVKVAKGRGSLAWHSHDGEDEVFYILANRDGGTRRGAAATIVPSRTRKPHAVAGGSVLSRRRSTPHMNTATRAITHAR